MHEDVHDNERSWQPRVLYLQKLPFNNDREGDMPTQKLGEFTFTRPILQEITTKEGCKTRRNYNETRKSGLK